MSSIAIIGQDGAGKSTISNMILESNIFIKFKYLYMGISVESSKINLPTSQLAHYLKIYKYKIKNKISDFDQAKKLYIDEMNKNRSKDVHGSIWLFGRLCNRLLEEWFRLLISKFYQLRGYTVIYDRHFVFDYAIDSNITKTKKIRTTDRIHYWILTHLYEKPGLIIFLYAPGELLFSRKGETTIEYIEQKNKLFKKIGETMPNFILVDASKPLEEVFSEVKENIIKYHNS
jgi:thymidylate kinase